MTILRPILALLSLNASIEADPGEPRPAVVLRLDQPDRQASAWLDLFRGTRVAHPAAALVAWKRASVEPDRLGKPAEALIAAMNPGMVEELRTLDGAKIAIRFEPNSDRVIWGMDLPGDDGTFATLATSLVLSGGATESTTDGWAMDRLGPPGSPWMARGANSLLVGGSPEGLREAQARSNRPRIAAGDAAIRFEIEPGAFDSPKSTWLRRLNILHGQVRGSISGSLGLDRSTLEFSTNARIEAPTRSGSVDPKWLERIPIDRVSAAFALSIDSSPAQWDASFRLADRIEKADPAFASTASLRLRSTLLARSFGLKLDDDLLFHLRGMSGWIVSDEHSIVLASVSFHLDSDAVADRTFDRIRPIPNGEPDRAEPVKVRLVGRIAGRPVRLRRENASIVASWGDDAMDLAIFTKERPGRSGRDLFDRAGENVQPRLLAAIWPSRIPGLIPPDSPSVKAFSGGSPIVWSGSVDPSGLGRLEARWDGLDGVIGRFLGAIPLDIPPHP